MALTAQEELIKETANKAYNCGENIAASLGQLMDTLQTNADGLQGVAGNQFITIQSELFEQVDKMNRRMDDLAELLIQTSDGLTSADLDLEQNMRSAWGSGSDAYADQLGSGNLQ